jgi:hypothetical protein
VVSFCRRKSPAPKSTKAFGGSEPKQWEKSVIMSPEAPTTGASLRMAPNLAAIAWLAVSSRHSSASQQFGNCNVATARIKRARQGNPVYAALNCPTSLTIAGGKLRCGLPLGHHLGVSLLTGLASVAPKKVPIAALQAINPMSPVPQTQCGIIDPVSETQGDCGTTGCMSGDGLGVRLRAAEAASRKRGWA